MSYKYKNCSNLKDITLLCDSKLPYIYGEVFCNCPELETFTITSEKEITNFSSTNTTAFDDSFIEYATLYIPYECDITGSVWANFGTIKRNPTKWDLVDGYEYYNTIPYGNLTINYTRTFNNTGWQALYIPFSLAYSDWKDKFEVAYINGVRQQDTDNDGAIDYQAMDVVKITNGKLKPNTPYLIRAKSTGEQTITTKGTIYPNEIKSIDCSTTVTEYTFTGTYSTIPVSTMIGNNYWAMGGGSLCPCSSDLKPFRWMMDIKSLDPMYELPSGVNAEIHICVIGEQDETTGIKNLYGSERSFVDCYDLSGRKVDSSHKGLIINNGKKYFIK